MVSFKLTGHDKFLKNLVTRHKEQVANATADALINEKASKQPSRWKKKPKRTNARAARDVPMQPPITTAGDSGPQMQDILRQVQALTSKVDQLAAEVESLKYETASLWVESASLRAESASRWAESASLRAESASRWAERASLRAERASLRAERASRWAERASLRAESASLRAESASLKDRVTSLEPAVKAQEITLMGPHGSLVDLVNSVSAWLDLKEKTLHCSP
ncbi:hypothetical protein BU15DRAFT_83805 [Melanogaster broomeanus]|nr:hypothetical protein BU15DRAFT_83805 [Melanogaster broomeanus]